MTKGEINLLYMEIDKLLNDICKFLNEEIQGGCISANGRIVASTLIERSKTQLQTIALNLNSSDSILESYVDMQAYKVPPDEDYPEPHEVYSDVSLIYEPTILTINTEQQLPCPFTNLPAYEVTEGKTGFLYRKEKILFFEQQKKVFAAIHNSWFLIYLNEMSLKPCQTFDLSQCEVRPSNTNPKDMKRRDESFDLIPSNDTKIHQFTAQTTKDMRQWVAALKQQMELLVTKRNFSHITPNKKIEDSARISTESNNDYEPLKNYMIKDMSKSNDHEIKMDETPLPLPPRNFTVKQAPLVPIIPRVPQVTKYIPRMPSEESLSSNYDSVGPGFLPQSHESSQSFSEDDSDNTYDDPSEIRMHSKYQPPINIKHNEEDDNDDDDIYDYLGKPTISQDTNFKQIAKPKPPLKPKIRLSLSNKK
ncbi:hypothetical protein FQA39_LY11245 [Lamprigera yunnana]|nr:hypothetical protein FQA39_LY11245 [Lamprigera yunnana]